MNKYSFKSLFNTPIEIDDNNKITISKVEIPRIQRDYAQGRIIKKNNTNVFNEKGRRFIECVFENLKSNKTMEMDFVYGAIKETQINQQKINVLLPLDGQQRLTTLFLLYWYIGNRELEVKTELFYILKRFSYETRTSSRRFCEIISNPLSINFGEETISDQIIDFSWFAKSYIQDPTIKAMLNMIDKIHELYGKSNLDLYKNLDNLQFCILPLNHFNLTDELYIKMNARGKQLTEFENFKADLIGWMKDHGESFNPHDKSKFVDYNGHKMPYYMAFSNKIDNEWTNMLWDITKHYNENGDNSTGKLVDPLLLSLFYRYFLFEYIFKSSSTNKEIDKEDYFKFFEKENSFNELKPFEPLLNIDCIHYFEQIIDMFSSNAQAIFEKAKASWNNAKALFLVEKGITQSQRVVLYGVFAYLKNNKYFNKEKFAQWMRVVWNIVENTDIDSWKSTIGVLELIKELEMHSDDIYSNFPDAITSFSSKNAVEEERKKIEFINVDPQWECAFIEAEKHPFLKGSVGFLISSGMSIDVFKHRVQIANLLFNDKGISDKYRTNHILLRALISQYTDFEQIKDRCFTDSDEKEHYLKKMLASDDIVRKTLCSWCSLPDETSLIQTLNSVIASNSTMTNKSNSFETKMHEELYKDASLQNWMQEKGAIRFAYYYWQDCYYVYRPKSWYDWILVDSYRDEIIKMLVTNYGCVQSNSVGSTKYHWGGSLLVKREKIKGANKYDFVYEFSPNGELRVGLKGSESISSITMHPIADEFKEEGWIYRRKYNYKKVKTPCDIQDFVNKIEADVFKAPDSLLNKLP